MWRDWRSPVVAAFLVVGVLLASRTLSPWAQNCAAPPLGESAEDLDRLLELHDVVFVARVERVTRRGVLAQEDTPENAELFVYQPPLKGSVPTDLVFDRTAPCAAEFSEGAVYLVFSNDLSSTPFQSEVRLILADERGPSVAWILDWIRGRSESGTSD